MPLRVVGPVIAQQILGLECLVGRHHRIPAVPLIVGSRSSQKREPDVRSGIWRGLASQSCVCTDHQWRSSVVSQLGTAGLSKDRGRFSSWYPPLTHPYLSTYRGKYFA